MGYIIGMKKGKRIKSRVNKQGLMSYIKNGLTVAQASDKDAKDPEAYREYGVPTAEKV